MATDDTYEGWKNRETWALNLWLSNDQALYELTLDRVRDAIRNVDQQDYMSTATYRMTAGEAVKDLWDEITSLNSVDRHGDLRGVSVETLRMVADVGSLWRVDWDEIGQHWLTAAQEDEQGSSDEIGAAWLESLEDQS